VGRWWGVDALAEKRFNLTPYHYVSNNPINRIDLFGLEDVNGDGKDDGTILPEVTVRAQRLDPVALDFSQRYYGGDIRQAENLTQLKRDYPSTWTMFTRSNSTEYNPYIWTDEEIEEGIDVEFEIALSFIGEELVFQGGMYIAQAGTKIIGNAQKTSTLGHALISKLYAWRYALDPRVERVTMDLGYKKLLGGGSFKYGPRPDVGALFKNGTIKIREIASKTDKISDLIQRNRNFIINNKILGEVLQPSTMVVKLHYTNQAVWNKLVVKSLLTF
jgi:hypothetical protein